MRSPAPDPVALAEEAITLCTVWREQCEALVEQVERCQAALEAVADAIFDELPPHVYAKVAARVRGILAEARRDGAAG